MGILSRFITWSSSSRLSSSSAKSDTPSKPSSTDKPDKHEAKRSQISAVRRLQKELQCLLQDPPTHCSCGPVGHDMFRWQGAIMGPADTPFDGGVFFVSIQIPPNYPYKPPKIKFQTKVYHPNVDGDGTIHVDILGNQWSPALTIGKMLLSICSLLPDPNAEDPMNPVSNLYRNERKRYSRVAREWTRKYAMS